MSMQTRRPVAFLNLLAALLSLSLAGRLAAADPELASGVAKGTFSQNGEAAVKLTNVAAFVDVKDDKKPTMIIISDKKLPTEKWTSEFDLMEAGDTAKFSGVIFWLDKDGNVFRCDTYWNGTPTSIGGYFTFKLDSKPGDKEIKGSAKNTSATPAKDDPKLDVTFHATLQ